MFGICLRVRFDNEYMYIMRLRMQIHAYLVSRVSVRDFPRVRLLMIAHTNTSIVRLPLSSHPCKCDNTRNPSMVQRSVKFIKNLIVYGKPDDNDKLESI